MSDTRTERRFEGTGVSPGIATAEVVFKHESVFEPEVYAIAEGQVEAERHRLKEALVRTRRQICEIQAAIAQEAGADDASIFDAHLLVLEDHAVLDKVFQKVEKERINIEAALYQVFANYMEGLSRVEDPYLKERTIDLRDVLRRILVNFREEGEIQEWVSEGVERPIIILAYDLTPSDTAGFTRSMVKGFVTETGSQTSHTAIMARSLGIPAVVGVPGMEGVAHNGDEVLIDGYHGIVFLHPSEERKAEYAALASEKSSIVEGLGDLATVEVTTEDGFRPVLSCNIEFPQEIDRVREFGGQGVGLYRTEFRYMNQRRLPTEDELTAEYAHVLRQAKPDGVIFRTLDVGGDKIPHHDGHRYAAEPNPFLGWRGIRLSLGEPELFRTQLRAMLRAGAEGDLSIMFPLVCCVEEIRQAKAHVSAVMEELAKEGTPHAENPPIGVMIEVPSAALTADLLAREVDFFSIGTNDLVQYTLAVDRVNQRVAGLYAPRHPAIVRLIRTVVEAAEHRGIWVGVCGEMAADLLSTPLLIGLGVTELSVGPGQLLGVKQAVRRLNREECRELVESVRALDSAESITDRCRALAERRYPELLRFLE